MSFIKVENVFLTPQNEYHLSVNEYYLWFLLRGLSNRRNKTVISIENVHQYMKSLQLDLFRSKKWENKKIVYECIQSLQSKKVIEIVRGDPSNNGSLLFIIFNENLTSDNIKGHEQLDDLLIETLSNKEFLYIYSVVAKWENSYSGCFLAGYEDWSEILDCSINTAKNRIKKCVDNKILYVKNSYYNDKNNSVIRGVNHYRITPFTDTEVDAECDDDDSTDEEIVHEDYGNWYNYKALLDVNDYLLYYRSSIKKFKDDCEKRISRICKSDRGKKAHEKLSRNAQDIINKEQEESVTALIHEVGDVILKTDKGIISFNEYNNEDIKGFWYFKEVNRFAPEINDTVPENVLEFNNNFLDIDKISAFRPKSADLWKNENDDPFAGLN